MIHALKQQQIQLFATKLYLYTNKSNKNINFLLNSNIFSMTTSS